MKKELVKCSWKNLEGLVITGMLAFDTATKASIEQSLKLIAVTK
jgi:hypothetical protein